MKETAIAALLCNLLSGGETELRHYFEALGETRHVRVDCETPGHVIEVGMDGSAGSRDSVHQAAFFAHLTGKTAMVIMIDRDGKEDRWEYEMRVVTERLGIAYGTCKASFLSAWSASAPFRGYRGRHDLPPLDVAKRHCDLAGQFGDAPAPVFPVLGLDKPGFFEEIPVPASLDD